MQVLTGPRQVGKTTVLLELAGRLPNAVYHAVDTPEAAMPGWWEAIWRDVQSRLKRGPAVVLLDEIQYLANWDRRTKAKAVSPCGTWVGCWSSAGVTLSFSRWCFAPATGRRTRSPACG